MSGLTIFCVDPRLDAIRDMVKQDVNPGSYTLSIPGASFEVEKLFPVIDFMHQEFGVDSVRPLAIVNHVLCARCRQLHGALEPREEIEHHKNSLWETKPQLLERFSFLDDVGLYLLTDATPAKIHPKVWQVLSKNALARPEKVS